MTLWTKKLNQLPTPCYIIDEGKLEKNLNKIKTIKDETNCSVILALKGFSTFETFPKIRKYLDGVTASSIYESKLGVEEFQKELHVHSIAMNKNECFQFNELADKMTFNSLNQLDQFKKTIKVIKPSLGIRINPGIGKAPTEKYNPCSSNSRLGIPIDKIETTIFDQIEGIHFHALCEQNIDPLLTILERIEKKFRNELHKLKWMNWGGGHLISSSSYKTDKLIKLINQWQNRYKIKIILEPGDAIGRDCGFYLTSILDIVENKSKIAICDLSISAHMPDVLEFPYQPDIMNSGLENEKNYNYIIGGNTCLASDTVGPYSFDKPLEVGEKVLFLDMGHYTLVKTSNFNGVNQPNIAIINESSEVKLISKSNYFNFKERLS